MSNFYEVKNIIMRMDHISFVKRGNSDPLSVLQRGNSDPFVYYVWVFGRKDPFEIFFDSQKDVDDFLDKIKKAMDNG